MQNIETSFVALPANRVVMIVQVENQRGTVCRLCVIIRAQMANSTSRYACEFDDL